MAGSFSDYLELELLDHVFGAETYTPPATLYIALYTSAASDTGGGTEVSGNGYARLAVTNNATNFPAASSGAKSNGIDFTFAAASGGAWGTITYAGILDASSGGNLLAWSDLTASKTIADGDVFNIPAGDLDITLA